MDTACNAASAGMALSWEVSAYILPLGSWSPKRLIGMLTSSAVTSYERSTPPPLRQLAAVGDGEPTAGELDIEVLTSVASPAASTRPARRKDFVRSRVTVRMAAA